VKNNLFILLLITSFCGYAQSSEFNTSKWRLNLSGGLGYGVANTSETEKALIEMGVAEKKVKDFIKSMRTGLQANAEVHYLFNKNIGLGIKYAFFTNSGNLNQIITANPASGFDNITTKIKETNYTHFIGPSFQIRSLINNSRWMFLATLSGGYAYLHGRGEIFHAPTSSHLEPIPLRFLGTGHTFGAYGGVGLEYFLNRQIALGIDMGFFHLLFKNLNVETADGPIFLQHLRGDSNFSRLNFSLGIKFLL
jgi:hypothetical protein